jgi:hypothetical protein
MARFPAEVEIFLYSSLALQPIRLPSKWPTDLRPRCTSSGLPISPIIINYYYWWGGTKTLGTAATSGLLYKPQMIDEDDCGAVGGMKIGRGNRSTRRKPAQAPLIHLTYRRAMNSWKHTAISLYAFISRYFFKSWIINQKSKYYIINKYNNILHNTKYMVSSISLIMLTLLILYCSCWIIT